MRHKIFTTLFILVISSSIALSQNYYLGVGNGTEQQGYSCSSCHTQGNIGLPIYDTWKLTKHAQAYDSLKSILSYDCLKCHTTGWDPATNNYGADEYVQKDTTKKPNYRIIDSVGFAAKKNIQCEDCHGALGNQDGTLSLDHWGFINGTGTNALNYSAQLCGNCHSGHSPYYEQWSASKHAQSAAPALSYVIKNKSCVRCHVAQNFIALMKSPSTYKDTILVTGSDIQPLTCVACHDPHDAKYPSQLRSDITYSQVICDKCHYAEIDSVNINSTPHEQSGLALSGDKNFGYRYTGQTYINSAHTYAATERCINCHVNNTPNPDGSVNTGHTFEPRVQACEGCHSDFATSVNLSDSTKMFDYRGVQSTTDSLISILQAKIKKSTKADSATLAFKEANYNLLAVQADGSHGVHNTRLSQKLLRDAIANYNPSITGVYTEKGIPTTYELSQNYPNPFNPTTTINFSLPEGANVKVVIYDAIGRVVTTLVDTYYSAGNYKVDWNASAYASGIYFYRIEAKNFNMVKKMVLMK
ncbi:MAG: T9SS type A sorting domain-containing protein [Bacteroidetes bacterium]|nr:T9SS type A sorting domain-containing protein [Bacteroidota bacterium]